MKRLKHIRKPTHSHPHRLLAIEARTDYLSKMHDSVTQSLFSLGLTLRAARRSMGPVGEESVRLLDQAERLAQRAVAEMCALTFEMRPQVLNEAGLASALHTYVHAVEARSKLTVHLHVKGEKRLSMELEEALYQIVREVLDELAEQSSAFEAQVKLDLEGEGVYIAIRSDRHVNDFPPAILSIIRTKANSIGGALEIGKLPEGGSETRVMVPEGGRLGST